MITATYLFPFAQEASNTTWALLGVAPTCLLWGLDARNSWTWLYSEGKKQFWPKPVPKPPFFDRDIRITKNILTACLVIMTLAGALSETMMAAHNAPIIGYPIRFLTVIAGIAFTGIYTTGPREILHQLAAFWQKRRKHSPRTHALREREEAALIQHIQIMRGLPEA